MAGVTEILQQLQGLVGLAGRLTGTGAPAARQDTRGQP